MQRLIISLICLLAASLACTLSRDSERGEPTPISENVINIREAEATATQLSLDTTPTPVPAPPTRLPTLIPTPLQFNPNQNSANLPPIVANPNPNANAPAPNVASAGGGLAVSVGSAAQGAPQGGNGYYFPNTIVYSSAGGLQAINRDGGGQRGIASGAQPSRSRNGLFVASAGGGSVNIVRPDGQTIAQSGTPTTLPTWSNDGGTVFYGSENSLVRANSGGTNPIDSVNGRLIVVEYAPDGGTVLYASQQHIKLLYGDGNTGTIWESGNERIVNGPYWATHRGNLGVYAVLDNGRRIFVSGGVSDITDPLERLQLRSPVTADGRVNLYADNGHSLTLIVFWPNAPERFIEVRRFEDVSWSPDGAQLVYIGTDGNLTLFDAGSGETRVLAGGASTRPIWSPPLYEVRN